MASQLSSHLHQILPLIFNIPPPPFELDNPSRVSQRSLMLNRQSCVLHLITTIIYFVISATTCICNLQSPLKIVWSKFSVVAKCHLELACPGLAAAVLWSPALSLVIIQDVQRLPSRSPLMSCHISVNELHIFNFFITHRLMFSRILPVCPNLHLPAVQSPPSPLLGGGVNIDRSKLSWFHLTQHSLAHLVMFYILGFAYGCKLPPRTAKTIFANPKAPPFGFEKIFFFKSPKIIFLAKPFNRNRSQDSKMV